MNQKIIDILYTVEQNFGPVVNTEMYRQLMQNRQEFLKQRVIAYIMETSYNRSDKIQYLKDILYCNAFFNYTEDEKNILKNAIAKLEEN